MNVRRENKKEPKKKFMDMITQTMDSEARWKRKQSNTIEEGK